MGDKNEILLKAKNILKNEMTTISYSTWIKNLEIRKIEDNKIILVVQSNMQKDALETRLYKELCETFNFVMNKNCEIEIIENNEEVNKEEEDFFIGDNYNETCLNKEYTFENFVIGGNNNFAHAVAIAVSEQPVTDYNPLFIYGGVGLGKTHLMHAIGNRIIQRNPDIKLLYVTSERFINDLVNSIKDANYKNQLFRYKYRNLDVLLIDDIQFLAGKKTGQEEFFHTFNQLFQNGKRIIISSDRPPRDIPLLEDRLKSRFDSGVLADISMPDYETRLAILKKKVQTNKIIIDDYILTLIATKNTSNVRELEGVLKKIIAFANLTNTEITIEMAEKAINDVIIQKENVVSIDYIQEVVSKYFNINKKDLISSKKSKAIVFPRQIAMYLCRTIADAPFEQIGKEFGNRHHTSVMHSVSKMENEIKENNHTKLIITSLKEMVLDTNR